jgi:Uma2 family endonuclease
MSTTASYLTPLAATGVGPTKRWTIGEFDDLVRLGFLREGSKTYLWDGEIIEPMAEKPPHLNAVTNLYRLLVTRIPADSWTIYQNAPLELEEGYKPQPDLLVLKGPLDQYNARAAVPADVGLLIEVADSSYPKDSGPFLRQYARAGIPIYWIVNIPERRIERYDGPVIGVDGTPGYLVRKFFGLDEQLPLATSHMGTVFLFDPIAVREVLRNSLDSPGQGKTT